jgi:hypothetical protein
MGIRTYIINGLLFALFIMALFSWIYQASSDFGSDILINDKVMNKTFNSMNKTLSGIQQTSADQWNATSTENPTKGSDSIIILSIKNSGTIFGGVISTIYNITFGFLGTALGIPPIVLAIFSAIIIISIIFFLWRMYRSGS